MTGRPGWRLVAAVVLANATVNLVHGLPHAAVPIQLSTWQSTVVAVVILGLPLAGLGLVWQGRGAPGAAAILVGGAGSAVFATYYHFFSATPDDVANVTGTWSLPFLLTALGISVLAVATAGVGGWLLFADTETAD